MRITVYCGSSRRVGEPFLSAARRVGEEIVRRGHQLVYGGGCTGLMGELADAVLAGGGSAEGVTMDAFIEAEAHHDGLTSLYETSDMRSRKAGLDERADAFITLAGSLGTLEEITEMLSFRKLGLHERPLVLLNTAGFYDPLIAQLEAIVKYGLDRPSILDYWRVTDDPELAVSLCED